MKICIKRAFCPVCQKLVRCHEQKEEHQTRVLCRKCGHTLWMWNGVRWRALSASS